MPAWTCLFGFLIGAVAGSFLNMVIYRLPRGISFINPASSICPVCKHALGWPDLMPIFSFLSTGGKCRYCQVKISPRYMLVELLCGGLFAAVWYKYQVLQDANLSTAVYMLTVACLVAAFFIDWELFIIPDEINALLLVIGLVFHGIVGSLPVALQGAFFGWALLFGISFGGRILLQKDAMGLGDVKLMRGVGAVIGAPLLGANVVIAVFAGLVFGLIFMGIDRMKGGSAVASTPVEPVPEPEPESLKSLLTGGIWTLLCLDIVGIFFPKIYRLIGIELTGANSEELDEEFTVTPSTIPFGPYLAVGTVLCILFSTEIQGATDAYWKYATGGKTTERSRSIELDRLPVG